MIASIAPTDQDRAQGKGHVGRAQRIERDRCKAEGQALSAKVGRGIDRSPAIGDIGLIGGDKAVRHDHFAIDQSGADNIADPVEGSEFGRGKFANALHNRLHHIGGRIRKSVMAGQSLDSGDMLQNEELLGDGGGKGHGLQ